MSYFIGEVCGCIFPIRADLWEETLANLTLLGQLLIATVSIPANCTRHDENLRLLLHIRYCLRKQGGAIHSGVPNGALPLLAPSLVTDPLSSEVDDGVESFQNSCIYFSRCRIPEELLLTLFGAPSDQPPNLMPASIQEGNQLGAYHPRGAGHQDLPSRRVAELRMMSHVPLETKFPCSEHLREASPDQPTAQHSVS